MKVKALSFEVTQLPPAEYPRDLLKIATIDSDVFAMSDSEKVFEKLRNKFTPFETYSDGLKVGDKMLLKKDIIFVFVRS